jgi:hypothetical protein
VTTVLNERVDVYVPLWWDAGTLADLSAWKAERLRLGAEHDEPFLASLRLGRAVKTFSRHTLRKRIRTARKILGAARLESLTIHHGRHTSTSPAWPSGSPRDLFETRRLRKASVGERKLSPAILSGCQLDRSVSAPFVPEAVSQVISMRRSGSNLRNRP